MLPNNKIPHNLFKAFFFLKAYQNPYVKPQSNNKEFTQRRRQQQLLTCNTQSSKRYSWCFVTEKKQLALLKKPTHSD